MDTRPIGVFDSGLGGLTVVKRLTEVLPGEDILYLGDTGRVPYGSRSKETITRYAAQDAQFLLRRGIKAMIVACNTVSATLGAAALQSLAPTELPVFGVVEAPARRAAAVTRNGTVGVIGTVATVRSGAYETAIHAANAELRVISRACPLLVPLVENGRTASDDVVTQTLVREYLADIVAAGADTLILGCTHYPLLAEVVRAAVGDSVTLIDSGAETAEFAARELERRGLLSLTRRLGAHRFFVTDTVDGFAESASHFLNTDAALPAERVEVDG
jgi:glutamate racemase